MIRTSVRIVSSPADPLEPAVLEHAEDLRLGQRRHVADLVQEQRSARALLELADPLAVGPGERPFSWPNSSLSSKVSGIAAQLIARNGPVARRLCW